MTSPSPAHGGTSASPPGRIFKLGDDEQFCEAVNRADVLGAARRAFEVTDALAVARLAALTRENEQLRARAEKARGEAVARVPSVDEMMHAFDEKQGKLDDPFRRNLWLAELAAVRDLVLRALAHDEGRGTK